MNAGCEREHVASISDTEEEVLPMALVWITDFHLLFHAFVSWSFGTFSASFPFSPLQPAREAGTSRQYHQFLFLLQSWSWCGTIRQQLARSSHSGKGDKIPCFATKTYTEARIKGLTWCWSSTKSCNLGTMATQWLGLSNHPIEHEWLLVDNCVGQGWVGAWFEVKCK